MTRLHFALVTGAVLAAAALCAQPPPDGESAAQRDLQALQRDVDAMRSLRDRLSGRLAQPDPRPLTYTLQFARFLSWSNRFGEREHGDLELTVFRANGRAVARPAVCGKWRSGAPNDADLSGLRFAEDGITGCVVVSINDLTPRAATVTVAIAVSGEALRGTYRADGSGGIGGPREDAVSGTVRVEQAALVLPPPPEAQNEWTLAEERHQTARWLDATTRVLYQDVRAHLLAMDGAWSYPHACRLAILETPLYPELPKLAASGKVRADTQRPPTLDDALDEAALVIGEPRGRQDPAGTPALPAGKSAARAAGEAEVQAAAAKNIAIIRGLVARRLAAVEAAVNASPGKPAVTVGSLDSGDPRFGPWYSQDALPSSPDKPNAIPSDAGAVGTPAWPWIADWTCVGPFPRFARGSETPLLPDVIPGTAFSYAVGSLRPAGKEPRWPPAPAFACLKGVVEAGTGFVRSPYLAVHDAVSGARRVELPHTTLYAVSEVFSEADRELWLGVTVNDHGQLWVNDRLVWTSPPVKAARYNTGTYVFKAAFRKGRNSLLFRCDNDLDDAGFSVRVCVRGQPRAAAEVAKDAAAMRPTRVAAAATHGWRYDGTGRYPDAHPPLAWDAERGINVRWRVPLGLCHATPLVVSNLVITFEEPDTAVALDKLTGAERWRTPVDIAAARGAAAQAESAAARARAAAAKAELARLGPGRSERLAALAGSGLEAAAAEARLKELDREARALLDFLKGLGAPDIGWYESIGYTYATPVTDGTRIFVKLFTGALGCLDLNGSLQWVVDHGLVSPKASGEACPSPLLVGGKVILFGPAQPQAARAGAPAERTFDPAAAEAAEPLPLAADGSGLAAVRAFDAATGRRLWSTPLTIEDRFCFPGTPVTMRLTGRDETLDVIAVPNGSLLRADDGRVLCRFVGARELYGSPVAEGHVVCFASASDKAAFELMPVDRDTVGVKPLWNVDHPGVFQDGNYGLFHEGRLYYSRPNPDVTDVATGALLWVSDNVFFAPPGRGYPPVAQAGGNLYVADNATWFQPTYRPGLVPYPGALSVVAPGVPGLVLARNRIEPVHGGFSFDGDRLYVRSTKSLMCLGHTGEAGRAYEAETVAAELLGGFLAEKPRPEAPARVAAWPAVSGKWASSTTRPLGLIRSWTAAGPFPASAAAELMRLLLDPGWAGWLAGDPPAPLAAHGVARELKRLSTENMPEWATDTRFDIRRKENFRRGPHIGWEGLLGDEIELFRVVPAAADSVAVLCTVLVNDYARLARFDAGGDAVTAAWLGGVAVRHGQCVELPPGPVPLVLVVRLDAPASGCVALRPRLWPSNGPAADLTAWQTHVTRCRPYLENAVAHAPESASGSRARTILGEAP